MRYHALAIVTMVLTGCNESKFDGASNTSATAEKEEVSADSLAAAPVTESFELKATRQPIDLVWVIDNSPSMVEENAIAQANLDAFVEKVQGVADLNMAVISLDDGPLAVKLSDSLKAKHHIQVAKPVGSTNLLALLASASCPQGTTEAYVANEGSYTGKMKICNQVIESAGDDGFLEDEITVYDVRGSLSSFYRKNAKKVFVFVTDDDADFVTSGSFLNLVTPYLGEGGQPVVNAFQALSLDACSVSAIGTSYKALAKQTGGQTFDICAQDWSDHFSRLTKSVEKVSAKPIKLQGKAKEILSVSVDGKKLKRTAFKLGKDGSVKLADAVFTYEPKKIEVTYVPN